jgi:hypothetical protein
VEPCHGGSLFYYPERSTPFGEILHPQISNVEQSAPQTNGGFWGLVPQNHTEFALVFGGLDSNAQGVGKTRGREKINKKLGAKVGAKIRASEPVCSSPDFCSGFYIII